MLSTLLMAIVGMLVLFVLFVMWILSLRRIVPTNEVHIVQKTKTTVSYGKDAQDKAGNTYYQIPAWVPKFGVVVSKLPTTVLDIDIPNYDAYDKDRLPFLIDLKAFFRIADFNKAASRVFTVKELQDQLQAIVKGAARSILAKEYLEDIMSKRNEYGEKFTVEVAAQLKEWGVEVVKNIELMDIRDASDSNVIANIMKKKKSAIEMESRKTVAENLQKAQEAEILAKQEIELKQQDAIRQVGLRKAEVDQEVGIAQEKQQQEVQAQAKVTAEKQMEVKRVQEVQSAEIEKSAAEVNAQKEKAVIEINAKASITKATAEKDVAILDGEADKQQRVLRAEAEKQTVVLNAEASKEQIELNAQATKTQIELKADADLKAAKNKAVGIEAVGKSEAAAKDLMEKAQVAGQITLADKIGQNKEYQDFVIQQKQVEAMCEVGKEQARNLGHAQIKIFANAGNVGDGVSAAGKIFNSQTGLDVGAALEGLAGTEMGQALIDKFLKKGE